MMERRHLNTDEIQRASSMQQVKLNQSEVFCYVSMNRALFAICGSAALRYQKGVQKLARPIYITDCKTSTDVN